MSSFEMMRGLKRKTTEQDEMTNHVESIMSDMEKAAKARSVRGQYCGNCQQVIEGVKWNVRDAASILWTRDGKRISRKKAAQQIGELLQ